jgi:hypothetical protein
MGLIRQPLEEDRGNYFVSYQPADAVRELAFLSITFPEDNFTVADVSNAMQSEARIWVGRYQVPTMIFAFDAKEDLIQVPESPTDSYFFAYIDSKTGTFFSQWGKGLSAPTEQMDEKYQNRIYGDLPAKRQEDIRASARAADHSRASTVAVILFFVAVVPVAIELIGLGVSWLGYLLSFLSILKGSHKAAKLFGWIKSSKREKEQEKATLEMRHHHYHCERNPDAFRRLKIENLEQDAIQQTREQAKRLRDKNRGVN